MSYSSITRATLDTDLQARVSAAVQKEAWNNATLKDTQFAVLARTNAATGMVQMMYPVAIATEAAYESALTSGRGAPGHDEDVITDAALLAAVQANWPADPTLQ